MQTYIHLSMYAFQVLLTGHKSSHQKPSSVIVLSSAIIASNSAIRSCACEHVTRGRLRFACAGTAQEDDLGEIKP